MVEESPHPFIFRKYEVLPPFGEPRTAAFCDKVKKEMPVILQAVFGDELAREWRENPWKFKVRPKVVKYNGMTIGEVFTRERFLEENRDDVRHTKREVSRAVLSKLAWEPAMKGSVLERGRDSVSYERDGDPDVPERWIFSFGWKEQYMGNAWVDSNGEFGFTVMENSPEESFRLNAEQLRLLARACGEVKRIFNNKEK